MRSSAGSLRGGQDRKHYRRGPLLTLAVEIEAVGDHLEVRAADEVLRFNSLPFRTEGETDARNAALARVLEQTPALPLTNDSLRAFVGVLSRSFPSSGSTPSSMGR